MADPNNMFETLLYDQTSHKISHNIKVGCGLLRIIITQKHYDTSNLQYRSLSTTQIFFYV